VKTIRANVVYMHDGQKLSPKLVYALPDDVADGLVSVGVAVHVDDAPDLTLAGMAWDAATERGSDLTPDPIVQDQADASGSLIESAIQERR
jgi:hypothetical protein